MTVSRPPSPGSAAGTPNAQIAADLHVSVDTVRRWRSRFAVGGLAALTDAKRSGRPVGPGRPAYQEFEYVRHGTVSIVAALDVQTGQVITEPIGRNDSVTFHRFLTMLDTAIDPAKQIHVVLDNGSSHVAKATRAWLAAHPRWHVHWTRSTPPGSTGRRRRVGGRRGGEGTRTARGAGR
ncbi:helix-turn-helix domain-containing protein [Salinispora sp. H7-4]|uniref:helix-turn-helix domain-containing protein n=1 Tax=Salinispora sp. H7-4 TaxID=2748321 RepID=UPI0015D165B1|nr:helix-turn-helix domain-containing protein [Salinispora sp. H7-4]NYT95279.1 transposase [Salinispora sp. H7-4]